MHTVTHRTRLVALTAWNMASRTLADELRQLMTHDAGDGTRHIFQVLRAVEVRPDHPLIHQESRKRHDGGNNIVLR